MKVKLKNLFLTTFILCILTLTVGCGQKVQQQNVLNQGDFTAEFQVFNNLKVEFFTLDKLHKERFGNSFIPGNIGNVQPKNALEASTAVKAFRPTVWALKEKIIHSITKEVASNNSNLQKIEALGKNVSTLEEENKTLSDRNKKLEETLQELLIAIEMTEQALE